jgi:hypothetical protein
MNTKTWICDTCGQVIQSENDGMVEWMHQHNPEGTARCWGLRLVHHKPVSPIKHGSGCQYEGSTADSSHCDLHLKDFLGEDGLILLLSFISEESFEKNELLTMIKRLHISGYEHAFRHFDEAIDDGVFKPNTKHDYYSQADIEAVIEWRRTKTKGS